MQNWINTFHQAIQNLIEKLEGWVNTIVVAIPNIIVAAIVLGVGILLSRYVNKYVGKLIRRFSNHQAVNRLISSIITTVFVLLVLFIVLSILQLDMALQSLLASAGVAGLAVGLALQDPIVNLFSGVMMSARHAFRIGDLIESNGYFGTISNINLRSTQVKTPEGQIVVLPNKLVYQNPLKNYTDGKQRRIDLSCGVSYADDLEEVQKIGVETINEQVEGILNRPVELLFTEFGDSSINFVLRFWIGDTNQTSYLKARSQAIIALKKAFDQAGVSIPFPIRTIDFGIEGGVPLAEAFPKGQFSKSNAN